MARNRSGFQPKIENLRWDGARHTFSAVSAGTAGQTVITDGSTKDTVMRIRGQLTAYIDGASAPGKLVELAFGLVVQPAGLGTTVVTSSITDADAPWMWYERFVLGTEEMVTDVVDVPGITSYRATVDVKAQRILRPGQELQLVLENATVLAGSAINAVLSLRILLGQH